MGAHEGAAVALDAGVGLPRRRRDGDAALLVGGEAHVDDTVLVARKRAHGKLVAFLGVHGTQDVRNYGRQALVTCACVKYGI